MTIDSFMLIVMQRRLSLCNLSSILRILERWYVWFYFRHCSMSKETRMKSNLHKYFCTSRVYSDNNLVILNKIKVIYCTGFLVSIFRLRNQRRNQLFTQSNLLERWGAPKQNPVNLLGVRSEFPTDLWSWRCAALTYI